jgi:hypothetical protein
VLADVNTDTAGIATALGAALLESISTSIARGAVFDAVEVASVYWNIELTMRSFAGAGCVPVALSDPHATTVVSVAIRMHRAAVVSFMQQSPLTGKGRVCRVSSKGSSLRVEQGHERNHGTGGERLVECICRRCDRDA